MNRRVLAAVVVLVATLAGCGTGDDAAAPAAGGQVELRVGDQKAGAQALLKAAGLLDGTPYKITFAQFTSGPPMLEAINAGAVDIGGVGNTPPIFAAAANSKIKVVAAYKQNVTGAAIVVPENSTLAGPADLKGRKVAVSKGSSAHYHLLAVLKKEGLKFSDIQPQYLQPADALAAFSGGTIDAWTIWEPFTSQANIQNKARTLVDGTGYVNGLNFQVAAPAAVDTKADAIRDFLTRMAKARVWALDHKPEWAKVWATETGLPQEVADAAVDNAVMSPIVIDDAVISSEQEMADAFIAEGLIPAGLKFADFADQRFNDIVGAAQ
ncbi:ABC transporter substrate-binding protein [Herbidospora mongoliensis]|uniref:ABC transporter substrate-binding protein n=1 Tax=Herbidospora mongoliensis TaxID=688067 RepID=UPI00083505B2|nr:ABC transporter substrate-binding protein [Herbidospora mongoliensis]